MPQAEVTQRQAQKRIAVIWTNYGPYHFARIKALQESHSDIRAIELCSFQRQYGWSAAARASVPLRTLVEGTSEDQNQFRVSILLWKCLQNDQPDTIVIPGYATLPAIVAAVWGKLRRKQSILMSESTAQDQKRSPIREFLKKIVVGGLFSAATVGGKRTAEYVESLGISRHKIGLFYDVVDNNSYQDGTDTIRSKALAADYGLPPKYFLFVGRLAPEKNLPTLVAAFDKYHQSGGTWHLVIVGDGPLSTQLRKQAEATAASSKIHFAGFKNGSDIFPSYAFAGCFVLPSISEPWGLVVNEAMASGLPVLISSHCGCVDDLVENGENGLIFDPHSGDDLASKLKRLSDLPEPKRREMGRRSLAKIGDYSPRNWAREVCRIAHS